METKFNIDKVSISEITSDFTGETRYLADVNIGIGTRAKLNVKAGIYDNPDFDLSKDSKISAIVIYSKQLLDLDKIKQLTGDPDFSDGDLSTLKRNTIVEIKKLSQIIRGSDGELLRDLFKDPKAAEENKEDASSFSLFESGGFDFYVDIEYSFSFQRDLNELYEPGEVKNLYVIVVPILHMSKDNKPPIIKKYYNLIEEQVIENDIFIGKNEDLRNNFYENLFSFDLSNISNEVKSMSSDLFPSYGKKKQIKGMFAIDKLNILRNMSDFGGLLDNTGLKDGELSSIVDSSQILDLKIKRQKIKKLLGFGEREEKISQNFIEETIASSRETLASGLYALDKVENIDKQGNLIGEMGEMGLKLAQGIKFVGFNDFDTSQEGLYQYCLDMSIKDGTRTYIEDKISSLIDQLKILENYYGEKFINKAESASLTAAAKSAEGISQVVMVLNNEAASLGESFTASVKNLLNYQQSTLNLIEFTNDLLKKLQDLPGISTGQVNSFVPENYSKNNTGRLTLHYSTKFSEYVDFTELKNINYDYIGIQQNDQIGISVLSNNDTKRRFGFEFFTKLINSDEFDGDFGNLQRKIFGDTFSFSKDSSSRPQTPKAAKAGAGSLAEEAIITEEEYFNLSQTYYSYLSPVGIRNNIISNSNVFDKDFFNDLHYKQIENTNDSKNVLLYEIMSAFGISISDVFYNNLYRGLKSVSSIKATSPKVKNYDGKIDNREDFIPLVNTILQKEENWSVSKESFTTTELKKNFKRYMPNHIRVLFGGKSDVCKNKWLSTEGDYFQNANTYYMMKQNFMNLVEIEALSFGKDSNGNIDLKNSSYRLLRDTDINSGATIICKSQNFQQIDLGVQIDLEKISYPNKYFIIGAGEQSAGVTTSSSTAETGLTVLNTQLDDDLSRDIGTNSNEIFINNGFVAKDVPESIVNADILKSSP